MPTFLLALAVLPGLVISYCIFWADKHEREAPAPLLACFALGAAATFPAIAVERWAFPLIGEHCDDFGLTFLLAFGAVGLNEELCKFAVLLVAALPWRFFNEPLDGIVYAVMIAMGFATVENVLYVNRFGVETAFLRAFTAVPAHLVFAIAQGYFVGLAKFDTAQRTHLLWQGLAVAVLLHGTYDFLILQNWSQWLTVLASLSLYLCLYFCGALFQEHLDNSPFRQKNDVEL